MNQTDRFGAAFRGWISFCRSESPAKNAQVIGRNSCWLNKKFLWNPLACSILHPIGWHTIPGWWFGWNMNFIFPFILGCCHHPNGRSHIFQDGVAKNHQPGFYCGWMSWTWSTSMAWAFYLRSYKHSIDTQQLVCWKRQHWSRCWTWWILSFPPGLGIDVPWCFTWPNKNGEISYPTNIWFGDVLKKDI